VAGMIPGHANECGIPWFSPVSCLGAEEMALHLDINSRGCVWLLEKGAVGVVAAAAELKRSSKVDPFPTGVAHAGEWIPDELEPLRGGAARRNEAGSYLSRGFSDSTCHRSTD